MAAAAYINNMVRIGKRHMELASSFATSLATFGAGGFLALLYFTDWRVFVDKIPVYNSKFPPPPPQ